MNINDLTDVELIEVKEAWEGVNEGQYHQWTHTRADGWDAFDVQSIAVCDTKKELSALERLWIAVLDSTHTGYNICYGGEGPTSGRPLSQETRDKIGAANRGKKRTAPPYARTEKHRQQLRDRMQGNRIGVGEKPNHYSKLKSPEERHLKGQQLAAARWKKEAANVVTG